MTDLLPAARAHDAAHHRPPHRANGSSLLGATGPTYFPVALVARLPYAMMVVGVLTLVVDARGSLALGGLNSAMVGLGAALVGPLLGAAADRFGQRRVLVGAGVVSTLALALMAWVVHTTLPSAAVLGVAFLVGASAPQVAPMSRSRLVAIIAARIAPERRERTFHGTMAYESAADEMVFIVGPVLVGVLAALIDPWAPVIGAAVLTLVFVTAFALHPTAAVAAGHRAQSVAPAPARDLVRPLVLVVVVGIFGVGLFFGSTLTSLTAFMTERGHGESAGLVYGVMGIGSAALALGVAAFSPRFSLSARWLVFAGVMLAGSLALPLVDSVLGLSLALLVIGLGIGPTMVTQYSLGALRSPAGRSSTVMTMLGSGVIVGQSAASALTGLVGEQAGAHAALALPTLAAAVVVLAGVVNARLARGAATPLTAQEPVVVD